MVDIGIIKWLIVDHINEFSQQFCLLGRWNRDGHAQQALLYHRHDKNGPEQPRWGKFCYYN